MTKWTDEQQLAIDKDGTNIIVSAGAGSGKTAVLTERVIRKLRDGVDVNHLLILTFTNAAAAEMKDRIRTSITKEKMYNQLDYIDSAYITTFDSYAQSIVKKYHYLLNISKEMKIVDSSILGIIKDKIIDEIFESKYGQVRFDNMISNYCEKNDTNLKKEIISINDKLDLKSEKNNYLDNYIKNNYTNEKINNYLIEYEKLILNKKNNLNEILKNVMANDEDDFYNKTLLVITPLLDSNSYEEIKNNLLFKIPTLPRNCSDELKKYKTNLSDCVKELSELCVYTEDEIKNNFLSTKDNVEEIIDIIKELDKKINCYKNDNESYEFTDIAKMAINIVKNNLDVREELKNYFNEIMVDEYQDTSDLQEEFISLISNNNVYMVGDIKQSIYRFRHANPEIFRNKYNNYSNNINGYKIDLLKNFRSRNEVLNNINEIFDSVMDEKIGNAEYQKSHRMIFSNKMYEENKAEQNYNLEIINYQKDDQTKYYKDEEIEAYLIGNDIKNKINNHYQVMYKDGDNFKLRDFNYGDACIIMDRGTAFDTYKKIFEYLSIPLVVWQDEVLNASDDIAVIKNIISLIIKIKNNLFDQEFKYYFTSVARSYLFEMSDETILEYFLNNNFKDSIIYKDAMLCANNLDEINCVELLKNIINVFNIYEKTIKIGNMEKAIIRIDNLMTSLKSLSDLGYTPYDLLEYFKESKDSVQKYSLNTKVPNNVNLMNIHKSKGLEFSVCYFSGFAKKFNDSDIKDSFIFDDKYGIIVPYYNNGIGNTILKDLYRNKYRLEDISERIRLFYVGLTRAKEQMIMVTSLSDKDNVVTNIVPDQTRLKYKSFLDIINSVKNKLSKYITNIDLNNINLSHDYDKIKITNFKDNISLCDEQIDNVKLNLSKEQIDESHYSKVTNKLHTYDEIKNMELGTYVHYLFETTDFNNPLVNDQFKNKIINFISKLNLNDAKIYKEYEFIYEENNEVKHGIIDLMLEYSDHIDIIDYKLKHVVDDNYKKQILGYKKYIMYKTGKNVNTYLYSIIDEQFNEIK